VDSDSEDSDNGQGRLEHNPIVLEDDDDDAPPAAGASRTEPIVL
jgi:hypothetical protein